MPLTPLAALRRRPLLAAAGAAAVLALAGTAVDAAVAAYAEHRTAAAFQAATRTAHAPAVTIDGFPATGQVVRGRLDRVDITAAAIPADPDEGRLPITRLDLELTGLRQAGDEKAAHSDTAKANAFLSYADLSDALGVGITAGDRPGYVDARVLLPLVGAGTVTAKVDAGADNTIVFTDLHVASGGLPDAGMRLLERLFDRPIPLRNLPQGLHLDSLQTSDTGLSAQLAGHDVTFRTDTPLDVPS
ncbi:DUF2993 domain-containing protein [Kitasatospora sp. NPDC048365]|uniref:LmeA family phospholipid-binding protein n=1 Tax=Kitasatospora sp. NPDC048365 TaxID=3364050 RepID=UPI0037136C1E